MFFVIIDLGYPQKNLNAYCQTVDSLLNANGKISLKLIGDFKLTKRISESNYIKMEFAANNDFLFVKTWYNINDSMANVMADNKKFMIENLFKTQPSPYPDIVSNQVGCPDRLKPLTFDTIVPNVRIFAFRLYANERFIYGECTDDVIVYTSAFIIAYNIKEKILTEIKYFTPKIKPVNTPEAVMRNIKSGSL